MNKMRNKQNPICFKRNFNIRTKRNADMWLIKNLVFSFSFLQHFLFYTVLWYCYFLVMKQPKIVVWFRLLQLTQGNVKLHFIMRSIKTRVVMQKRSCDEDPIISYFIYQQWFRIKEKHFIVLWLRTLWFLLLIATKVLQPQLYMWP